MLLDAVLCGVESGLRALGSVDWELLSNGEDVLWYAGLKDCSRLDSPLYTLLFITHSSMSFILFL